MCFVPPYVERIGTIPKAQIVQKSKEHLVAANRVTNAVVTDLLSSEPVTYPKAEGACIALNKILNGTGPAQIMEGEIVFAAFAMPNLKTWMDRLELDEDALTAGSGVPRDVILDVIGSGTPDRPDGARLPYTVARRLFDALKAAHAARGDAKPLFVRDLITSNKSAGDLRVPRILNRTGSKHDCILPRALIVPAPQDGHPWARGTKQEEAGWTPGSANG